MPGLPQIAAVIGLGLLPMAAGHTLYNAAVRRAHAAYANLIATQEVTGGVLLGVLLLAELPGPTTIAGLVVTLFGIGLVLFTSPGRGVLPAPHAESLITHRGEEIGEEEREEIDVQSR